MYMCLIVEADEAYLLCLPLPLFHAAALTKEDGGVDPVITMCLSG